MDLGLKGKVALVTGAGAGNGRAVCLALAREGAYVAVNDLPRDSASEKKWISARGGQKLEDVVGKEFSARVGDSRALSVANECRALGVKAIPAEADVTNLGDVERMVEKVVAEFGRVDILVNNAGASGGAEDLVNTNKEKWDFIINLCLYSVINCCKTVLPHMIKQRGGKIVNFLSETWKGADKGMAIYGAAKAGVSSLTRTAALEAAPYGINVNAVSPGTVTTEWMMQSRERQKQQMGEETFEARLKKKMALYPLTRAYGEVTSPEDIADLVVFLSSERAKWITGQSISISGGYHMH
ncbi:MAG: SDR family oxidoreductase [Chloroflexi bacterium]|nr:SDR family oxidoreductase [Chloroflexota bacterium]